MRNPLLAAFLAALAGCAAPAPRTAPLAGTAAQAAEPADAHVPDFARKPFEPFNRQDAIAIALREWRLFGQLVDDDPPESRPVPPPNLKPEREPGLWQRVGEYWWLGIDADQAQSAWTGKFDEFGYEFPAGQDGNFAWSAAFISYIMRSDGAGPRFPYSINHAHYINVAWQMTNNQTSGYVIDAERADLYAPVAGDLICFSRIGRRELHYSDLPRATFPAHCAIVTAAQPGTLDIIGGNVDDAVTLTHVPTTPDGKIANADGTVVDTRYPWFVVLRVHYDSETELNAQVISRN
jgi:hypothetical protein